MDFGPLTKSENDISMKVFCFLSAGSKPSELANTDTVRVAFAGRIIANKTKPAVIQIKSAFNGFTYSVFKNQIEEAYQGGTKR